MSFFILWSKEDERQRPSSVNIPTARSASYHSSLWNDGRHHKYTPIDNHHPNTSWTPAQNILSDMLITCLNARRAVKHFEYFHIAKIAAILREAMDSRKVWLTLLEKCKYKFVFEKQLPELLLCISDFRNPQDDEIDKTRAERANRKLNVYIGSLKTGELLRLMKLTTKPRK